MAPSHSNLYIATKKSSGSFLNVTAEFYISDTCTIIIIGFKMTVALAIIEQAQ